MDPQFDAWTASLPSDTTADPVWRLHCYREALFLLALARDDARRLGADAACAQVAPQLLRAAGSVAANIAEGYGRPTNADRIRFMSYALGSAREVATWYEAARYAIPDEEHGDRTARLARVRKMLQGLLVRLRTRTGRKFEKW